jgi:hypothetical protein
MSAANAVAPAGLRLLPQVTCPHCWERFPPEAVLWVSEHAELLGDPLLGREQQQRFLPSRFTPGGDAIDPKGLVATQLACPRCHLLVPRGLTELEPLFLSILGAPGSGKSYFLTAATWSLRQVLPHDFAVAFADADPGANRTLAEYEEALFLNPRNDRALPLGSLIRKTELQGELYDSVSYGQHTVSYPRPYLFGLRPLDAHPNAAKAASLGRMLCLYDNAGEHFQPGQDTASSPVTRHLAHSRALLFLFDPTQDRRFRDACRRTGGSTALGEDGDRRLSRQETILSEAAARIRRHAGLAQHEKHDRPLVVVLSKFDAWSHLLGDTDASDPWRPARGGSVSGLHVERVESQSANLRRLLAQFCPETVAAAESFAREVTYIPVSAVGGETEVDPKTGSLSIRPDAIRPHWAAVPFLYLLSRLQPGLVPRLQRKSRAAE